MEPVYFVIVRLNADKTNTFTMYEILKVVKGVASELQAVYDQEVLPYQRTLITNVRCMVFSRHEDEQAFMKQF